MSDTVRIETNPNRLFINDHEVMAVGLTLRIDHSNIPILDVEYPCFAVSFSGKATVHHHCPLSEAE